MKQFIIILQLMIFLSLLIFPQRKVIVPQDSFYPVEVNNMSKIASGDVFSLLNEKSFLKQLNLESINEITDFALMTIYFDEEPSLDQINSLEKLGIQLYSETWIPPLQNHPLGFMIAKVPVNNFNLLLREDFVMKVGSAENVFEPNNNLGTIAINANSVWSAGWTGTGVKVAILDSGLDTEPTNSALPSTIEKKDYSTFPILDNDVENHVTGHGTHVTGSVLGRGVLSSGNIGNGGGAYKGSAPDADLVFLKIGGDVSSSASDAAIIAAMQAAVNIYSADVISMSYGGWDAYHDGSGSEEQTVDWAYSQGVPVILSAGNSAEDARHYSGTVNAYSETGYIQVNVTGAGVNNTRLYFNLVWADGSDRNNLTLKYYNSSYSELTAVTRYTTTQSTRGTESQYSYYNNWLPVGSGIYYLKVVNPSDNNQFFHIYDDWGDNVTFNTPDPYYTIGSPSLADNALAVGSFTSRSIWTASDGSSYWYGPSFVMDNIAPYSSCGPRIDGLTKPNIAAPGHVIISIRDRDVYTTVNSLWVDNDGTIPGGDANYYVMTGTSMAAPLVAGAVALILDRYPSATPSQIYAALQNNATTDGYTGSIPNNTWGYGKLDIYDAINDPAVPVELSTFSAINNGSTVIISWRTETEIQNYGFEVERKEGNTPSSFANDNTNSFEKIGFVQGNGNSNSPKEYTFVDNSAKTGKYFYRLKQIDSDGSTSYSKVIEIDLNTPKKYELSQNYPNPFNPITSINFILPISGHVRLTLLNILGEELRTLVNEFKEAGIHTINFDARDLESGVYIYKIEAGSFTQTRKMVFLK
jgi:subtilisin family serine protease